MSADDAREKLIDTFLDAFDGPGEGVTVALDALLARRDLILEALGGEISGGIVDGKFYAYIHWPNAPEAVPLWRFPVDSTESG